MCPPGPLCPWSCRGHLWEAVPGCERVQEPLACELTRTLSRENLVYIIRVTALLEGQALGWAEQRFNPFRDSRWSSRSRGPGGWQVLVGPSSLFSAPSAHLDPPLLTLAACGGTLCVDLQPPEETLRDAYQALRYTLRVRTGQGESTQVRYRPRQQEGAPGPPPASSIFSCACRASGLWEDGFWRTLILVGSTASPSASLTLW